MRQYFNLLWCLKFDKCDERHCAEPNSSSFGCTDTCPGCANARAGRKQAVDHSEQCRSRMEAILVTTTEGHERLERRRDRFDQAAKEREDEEPQRKRHRPEGEGEQPLAPPGEGCSTGSGSALPPSPAPPPLEPPPLAKRSLGKETEITDATVEQQRESKRRREHPEASRVADSSSSSSNVESSTDTEMELVDVCTILCENSDRATKKHFAVAEERERWTGNV